MTRPELELILRRATPDEIARSWELNHEEWGKGLDAELYFKREEHLMSQALTRNGGILHWVLVDKAKPDVVLSTCETIRKGALVKYKDGRIVRSVSHVIGSVYTPLEHRGKGYGKAMLELVAKEITELRLDVGGKSEVVKSPFSVLYSDIGRVFYSKLGWYPHSAVHAVLPQRKRPSDIDPESLPLEIRAKDIRGLCWKDVHHQDATMKSTPLKDGCEASVRFLCSKEVVDWHHAREEFLHLHLPQDFLEEKTGIVGHHPRPEIKGAMSRSGKQWVLWTRIYVEKKLAILRYADMDDSEETTPEEKKKVIKSLLCAAMNEAYNSGMEEVHIWNPSTAMRECILDMPLDQPKANFVRCAQIVHRDQYSIPCLRWNEDPTMDSSKIVWEENEFFGWC